MLKNYLLIALRSLSRRKTFSIINILGLAVGMACFILVAFYVKYECSYENTHQNANRIYRVSMSYSARSAPKLAPMLQQDFAEVEKALRLMRYSGILQQGTANYFERDFYFAQADLFDVFSFHFLEGDREQALTGPDQLVISETAAQKYFGHTQVIGESLTFLDSIQLTIAGVVADPPPNTHLKMHFIASFEMYKRLGYNLDTWSNQVYYTYALLDENTDPGHFKAKIPAFLDRHVHNQPNLENYGLEVMNVRQIHLHSNKPMETEPNSKLSYVFIFSSIALVILLIAIINFINLSTALAARRAKEIGVRKSIGAHFNQLMTQFLSESMMVSFLSGLLALGMARLGLPLMNDIANIAISGDLFYQPLVLIGVFGLSLIVGILAGIYPAFVLSSFQAREVFTGHFNKGFSGLTLRRSLVVLQFSLSVILLIGALVVYQQLHFMKDQPLGFDKEQVMVIPFFWDGKVQEQYAPLKEKLLQHTYIEEVTASGDIPGRMSTTMAYWAEGMPEDKSNGIQALYVNWDFIPTYGMEMIAGRAFNEDINSDLEEGYILNEKAVLDIGWTPEEAIGKKFSVHTAGRVIGVVKDFHYNSLQEAVNPIFISLRPSWCGYLSLRLNTEEVTHTLSSIEHTWKNILPDRPLQYYFLDEDFDRQYLAENRLGRIVSILSFMAIFIAAIGLFGLSTYIIESRTKEVAVRKILGASAWNVLFLFSKEFSRPIVLSLALAIPIAYWGINNWLQQFAYSIQIKPWIFLLAALSLMIVSLLSIGLQSVRAALVNPSQWLREE